MWPHLAVQGHSVSLAGVIVLGIAVGFVAGLFGVGGGFLLTPLLNVVFGVPVPVAVGTGLSLMVGTAVPALLRHRRQGQGEVRFDLVMLGGSLLGVDAGARVLDRLTHLGTLTIGGRAHALAPLIVQGGYVLLLGAAAAVFWRQARAGAEASCGDASGTARALVVPPRANFPAVGLRGVALIPLSYLGFGLGFLSGLLGIGGGVALMPVLVHGYGFPFRQAAGTGILVLIVSAGFGTFLHALRGHVHLGLVAALLVGASVSAQMARWRRDACWSGPYGELLRCVLVGAAVAVVWNLLRT